MPQKAVPMIHVPDVRATMEWYASIGCKVIRYNEEDGEINWALLTFGDSELMFDSGGKPSDAHRREADLYLQVDDVETFCRRLEGQVEVVEELARHLLRNARVHHSGCEPVLDYIRTSHRRLMSHEQLDNVKVKFR